MDCETVPSLEERLTEIRGYSSEDVVGLISKLDLLSRLPTDFLDSLDDKDRVICFRATLLVQWNGALVQGMVFARWRGFRMTELPSAELKVNIIKFDPGFCDSGFWEELKAEGSENTWFLYGWGAIYEVGCKSK